MKKKNKNKIKNKNRQPQPAEPATDDSRNPHKRIATDSRTAGTPPAPATQQATQPHAAGEPARLIAQPHTSTHHSHHTQLMNTTRSRHSDSRPTATTQEKQTTP